LRTKRIIQGVFWVIIYLLITLAPLLILMAGSRLPGRDFWRDFSVALGFAGLGMMALQFALTARFKTVRAPYGIDLVYFFHRQISVVAFVLILAHPIILFISDPETLGLLNVFTAPWRARAAVTATLALIILVVISIWRKQLKIDYTRWRIWHGTLAIAAVTFGLVHAVLVGYYINTPEKRLFWVAYGLFFVGLLFYVRLIKPLMLMRKPFRVTEVREELGSTWRLVLAPEGHGGFDFIPGQFAWITAWSSPFADTEHPFTISSSPRKDGVLEFTIKELGDFTRSIKDLPPGARVYVDGPYGIFSADHHPHAQGFVFIAGGIGITPMISMLRTMADRGEQRPLMLIYANRDLESMTYHEEIGELEKVLNLMVIYVLERPPEGWQGETGFLTLEMLDRYLPEDRRKNAYEIFICGPKPMMDVVESALVKMGIDVGDFHSERFDMV
jgi:predicted ferric reductase